MEKNEQRRLLELLRSICRSCGEKEAARTANDLWLDPVSLDHVLDGLTAVERTSGLPGTVRRSVALCKLALTGKADDEALIVFAHHLAATGYPGTEVGHNDERLLLELLRSACSCSGQQEATRKVKDLWLDPKSLQHIIDGLTAVERMPGLPADLHRAVALCKTALTGKTNDEAFVRVVDEICGTG